VPLADQHLRVSRHRRVNRVARHVPAEDAVARRRGHAADLVARIDVLQGDVGAARGEVLHDPIAQHQADVLQPHVAAGVGRAGVARRWRYISAQVLPRPLRDDDDGVLALGQPALQAGEEAARPVEPHRHLRIRADKKNKGAFADKAPFRLPRRFDSQAFGLR
jgi:hypothetical protein